MKIIPSPLVLKIVVIFFALFGTAAIIWNINYIFQLNLSSPSQNTIVTRNMIVEHAIVGGLYLIMAIFFFKLVGGTSNREIISRKNLKSVNGILYILCALVVTKIVFASFIAFGPIGRTHGIGFQLVSLIFLRGNL
ncbi:MAG: hypothetical protein J7623_30090 [Chitinophaga sp.]|uniref:hypothetical protein n=1 Tax=Chitinophaga sp. TaxID=1869181 RepID=UPI001AFE7168|nr:hypothetical protein [Chitinophaga sp.]MBO9732933.1 hypothetical protein [Chitinophaga sp.]